MAEEFWEGTKKGKGGTAIVKMSEDQKKVWDIIQKMKPAQWKALHGFMGEAKDILAQGGIASFFMGQLSQIKDDIISMVVDPILAPILEQLAPVIAELMEDILPEIREASAELGELISDVLDMELPGGMTLGDFLANAIGEGIRLMLQQFGAGLAEMFNDIKNWWEDIFGTKPWPGPDPMAEFIEDIWGQLGVEGYEFE